MPPFLPTTTVPDSVASFPCPKHPLSTIDMESCSARHLLALNVRVNKRMKVVWSYLLSATARRYFVKAEREWSAYVNNECTSTSGTWPDSLDPHMYEGGSSAPLNYASCEEELTVAYLRELANTAAWQTAWFVPRKNKSLSHDVHAPTASEQRGLVLAVRNWAGGSLPVKSVTVSTIDRSWASVEDSGGGRDLTLLFDRHAGRWNLVDDWVVGKTVDSGCAFAPAPVMRDFYGFKCPPWRALRARQATATERGELVAAYFTGPPKTPPQKRSQVHLVSPCISRLDSSWAEGGMVYGDLNDGEMLRSAGPFVFFRYRGTRWRLAQVRPSHTVALSLASCSGNDAAQHGG